MTCAPHAQRTWRSTPERTATTRGTAKSQGTRTFSRVFTRSPRVHRTRQGKGDTSFTWARGGHSEAQQPRGLAAAQGCTWQSPTPRHPQCTPERGGGGGAWKEGERGVVWRRLLGLYVVNWASRCIDERFTSTDLINPEDTGSISPVLLSLNLVKACLSRGRARAHKESRFVHSVAPTTARDVTRHGRSPRRRGQRDFHCGLQLPQDAQRRSRMSIALSAPRRAKPQIVHGGQRDPKGRDWRRAMGGTRGCCWLWVGGLVVEGRAFCSAEAPTQRIAEKESERGRRAGRHHAARVVAWNMEKRERENVPKL